MKETNQQKELQPTEQENIGQLYCTLLVASLY